MKPFRVGYLLLLVTLAATPACRHGTAKAAPASKSLLELSGESSLSWPPGARLFASETEPRAEAEGAGAWVLEGPSAFSLPGPIPAESVRASVALEAPEVGASLTPNAHCHEWTSAKSRWSGCELDTAKAVYLVLTKNPR